MTREDWLQNFGENLQDILFDKNINQRELSDMTGISTSTISDYITGKRMPSCESIIKIVYALEDIRDGRDVDYFDLLDFGDTID